MPQPPKYLEAGNPVGGTVEMGVGSEQDSGPAWGLKKENISGSQSWEIWETTARRSAHGCAGEEEGLGQG